jgi:pyruvate dehydrogenase E2 component (dihydrolipoamide acetyltransferase)
LGIAVALPGDEMVTAVVRDAGRMDRQEFFDAVATQIESARDGRDQADESTTLTISNIGKAGMRIGIPAIVAPAVATLAIGETFAQPVPEGNSFKFTTMATATLSFDHRVANGVGAANFLNDIKAEIQSFRI